MQEISTRHAANVVKATPHLSDRGCSVDAGGSQQRRWELSADTCSSAWCSTEFIYLPSQAIHRMQRRLKTDSLFLFALFLRCTYLSVFFLFCVARPIKLFGDINYTQTRGVESVPRPRPPRVKMPKN